MINITEVNRLKIKCNQYAKRLVLEGYDDVSWEATTQLDVIAQEDDSTNKSFPTIEDVLREMPEMKELLCTNYEKFVEHKEILIKTMKVIEKLLLLE